MSRVTCCMSRVTCHVSHVMCHMNFFFNFFFFLRSGEATRWRVCYQRGLPRLISIECQNETDYARETAHHNFPSFCTYQNNHPSKCRICVSVSWLLLRDEIQTMTRQPAGFEAADVVLQHYGDISPKRPNIKEQSSENPRTLKKSRYIVDESISIITRRGSSVDNRPSTK